MAAHEIEFLKLVDSFEFVDSLDFCLFDFVVVNIFHGLDLDGKA